MFRENEGRGWCRGDGVFIPATQSFTLQVKHRDKDNGFKLHLGKEVLIIMVGSFVSK